MSVPLSSPTLVVPIDVTALCIGQNDQVGPADDPYGTDDFARVTADFSILPYLDENRVPVNRKAYISEHVLPQPFAPVSEGLGPGIHLHWALPDALAHGVTDDNGNVQFREAPNRWLVVRIASSRAVPAAPEVAVRAWVVESDHLWDQESTQDTLTQNANSLAVPLQPRPSAHPNKAFQALGRIFPYEEWSETPGGTYLARHTALGYGTLTYAAAYPHCPNVFGFHDPLADLDLTAYAPASSRLSYLVAGWYSNGQNDPLARLQYPVGADHNQQRAAIEQALHWTFEADSGTPIPTQTLCNGLLTDIPWDPTHRYIVKRPETPLQVAIGNTTIEALSALLASQPDLGRLDQIERVLTWLQLNLLARLGQAGSLGAIEEAQHQAGFGTTTAGMIWQVQRKTAGNATDRQTVVIDDQDLLDAAGSLEITLPEDLANELNALNAVQQSCDKAACEIESRRGQIFADWYKYMLLEHPEGGDSSTLVTADDAYHGIEDEVKTLDAAVTALHDLITRRDALRQALLAKLGQDYLLSTVAGPRYWHANDPVLLISGADSQPSYRHGGDGRFNSDGNLVCRLTSGLIAALTAPATTSGGPWTVHTGDLPTLPASPNRSLLPELRALLGEAFFLDPNQAWLLARSVAAQGGTAAPTASLDTLVQGIQAAQSSLFTMPSTAVTLTGQVPSLVGFQTWSQPWIPLMLQWEISYYPLQPINPTAGSQTAYSPDLVTSHCRLDDDDIDLTYLQAVTPDASTARVYQGSMVLAHNTAINLAAQIDRFLAAYPDDSHAAQLQTIKQSLNLSMMAQSLDGFHQALQMRKQTLQLPVADPLAITSGLDHYNFSNVKVANAVGDRNDTAPLPLNSYNPLRLGGMEITRLRIVDAFGQTRDILQPALARAESLRRVGEGTVGTMVTLPPRISQPSRLLLRWLSAADDQVETNSHPASTPVCGWVLFNRLDESLALYAADGSPLGSLSVRGPLWQGAPGNNATFDQPIEAALARANPHLQKFAFGIAHNPNAVDFLRDLLRTIDRTVTLVNPASFKQDQGLSVLVSQPLALCRASLRLELRGLPSLNQSWGAFAEAVSVRRHTGTFPDIAARDAGAFPGVAFPVRLGDLSQVDDGLIGYFVDDGTEQAYRAFYAGASESPEHGVIRPAPDQLSVTAADSAPDILLTLLMDPRASVHATTGILPVKSIRVPPDMYAAALNRLAVTFLTAPVLSPTARFAVPTPSESGHAWAWVTRTPGTPGWTVLDPVGQVNPGATLGAPQQISEGWLSLHSAPPPTTPAEGS